MPYFETAYVLPCRSTTLSLSSSDEMRAPLFLKHSKGSFTHEALEGRMIDGIHLVMESTFHYQDEVFLMRSSRLKEEIISTTCIDLYGFQWAMDALVINERVWKSHYISYEEQEVSYLLTDP